MAKPSKLFGLGLNKTGTSSLRRALETLDYRVCGPRRDLLRAMRRGDLSGIGPIVANHDAFEDLPWPLLFEHLFESYGRDAKFVLTTRASPEKWFRSIENHARTNRPLNDTWRLAYGSFRPFGREREYIRLYMDHNARVRDFFMRHGAQDRLLELCFENGDGWEKLCPFLGEAVPHRPFPHSNRTGERRRPLVRALNMVVEPLYRAYASRTAGGQGT